MQTERLEMWPIKIQHSMAHYLQGLYFRTTCKRYPICERSPLSFLRIWLIKMLHWNGFYRSLQNMGKEYCQYGNRLICIFLKQLACVRKYTKRFTFIYLFTRCIFVWGKNGNFEQTAGVLTHTIWIVLGKIKRFPLLTYSAVQKILSHHS